MRYILQHVGVDAYCLYSLYVLVFLFLVPFLAPATHEKSTWFIGISYKGIDHGFHPIRPGSRRKTTSSFFSKSHPVRGKGVINHHITCQLPSSRPLISTLALFVLHGRRHSLDVFLFWSSSPSSSSSSSFSSSCSCSCSCSCLLTHRD